MRKRVLVALLAVCMTVTTIGMDAQAYYESSPAGEEQQEMEQQEEVSQQEEFEQQEEVNQQEETEEISDQENSEVEEAEESTEQKSTEEEQVPEQEKVEKEETKEDSQQEESQGAENSSKQKKEALEGQKEVKEEAPQQQAVLNYILMEKDNMEVPDIQNVVASLGQEGTAIGNAKLTYQNETTGEEITVDAANTVQDMVLFSMKFQEASQAGSYVLKYVTYTEDGIEKRVALSELEMNVRFGVNTKVEAKPDDILINQDMLKEVEANVITMDENGNTISENTVENVLDSSQGVLPAQARTFAVTEERGAKNLVVVLDPGHDDTHAGTQRSEAGEEDLVLKIVKYCRDELKKYGGITVYMTRESGTCPYPGTSATDCNAKRVEFATGKRADVYVSFHLNASTSSVPNGVGVYYPNSSYRPDLGQEGKELATEIYNKLSVLGLANWAGGTLIENSKDNTLYPDGSLADYLGVIRRSKLAGIPAVLIEHAFLSNYADYMNFLSSDAKLQTLGIADASAIASYYGLQKIGSTVSISYVRSRGDTLGMKWNKVGADSYEVYRSTSKSSGYSRIATVSGNTYKDSKISAQKTYYYKIRPVFSNSSKGAYSDPKSGWMLGKSQISSVDSISSKRLEVTWKSAKNATGYQLYRNTSEKGSYQLVKEISGKDSTVYVDTVPKSNVKYYYKVRATSTRYGVEGYGACSNVVLGRTVANARIKSVVSVTDRSLQVTWGKISGASGYQVAKCSKKNGDYSIIANIKGGSVTTYKDNFKGKPKTYYYKVRAVNSVNGKTGYSAWSSVWSGTTVGKPTSFTAGSGSSDAVKVSWKKVKGASGYKVARSGTLNGTYKVIATTKSSASSYVDKKVSQDKTYYYKIKSINKVNGVSGESGYVEPIAVKTTKKTAITNIKSVTSSSVEIKWKPVSGSYGYQVKRSTSKNGTYKKVTGIRGKNNVTYQDKNLQSGKRYYYVVEVVNKTNGRKTYSGNSAPVAGRPLARTAIISRETQNSGRIGLKWKKVTGANGYEISRREAGSKKYKVVANVKGESTTSYTDQTGNSGVSYYYRVKAYRQKGKEKGYASVSKSAKAWTLDTVNLKKMSGSKGNSITLQWNKIDQASGYRIQRSNSKSSGFKTIEMIDSASTTKFTDKNVAAGKTYYYRIAATNKIAGTAGRGSYGSVKGLSVMSTPKISSVKSTDGNGLKISWKNVSNAAGYRVQRSTSSDNGYKIIGSVSGTSYIDSSIQSGETYYYRICSFAKNKTGDKSYSSWSSNKKANTAYSIMGESDVTISQMVKYYSTKYQYPASFYATKGAPNIQTFCKILMQEAEYEGVRAEVLFAQVILETGGLQYRGDVKREQCNFGGLGATGNGVTGEIFPNVRTGLRAQVQHLKAYASKEPLKRTCVDNRFKYVKRGSAPYVEWLPIPKNPNGTGWAADPDYDVKLLKIIQDVI